MSMSVGRRLEGTSAGATMIRFLKGLLNFKNRMFISPSETEVPPGVSP